MPPTGFEPVLTREKPVPASIERRLAELRSGSGNRPGLRGSRGERAREYALCKSAKERAEAGDVSAAVEARVWVAVEPVLLEVASAFDEQLEAA